MLTTQKLNAFITNNSHNFKLACDTLFQMDETKTKTPISSSSININLLGGNPSQFFTHA